MQLGKLGAFLLQSAAVGLLAAFILLLIRPELAQFRPRVVEVQRAIPVSTNAANWSGPVSYADAVARAAPAVVNIYTAKVVTEKTHPFFSDPLFRQFFGDQLGRERQRLQTSLGSGVIISAHGYVLTNDHVVSGADQIQVLLSDGRTRDATLVGADPETDIAVLKIAPGDLPSIVVGDSENLRVGDVVLAIGNPFGVGQTVTQGIVSATGRNRLGISTYENFIQTDAAINPGNSGGALINARGELIGINTAIFSRSGGSQGIGFAIPESLAKGVMQQIIETGSVVRGWLGIEAQSLTPELAESLGIPTTDGVLIAGVVRNGPADGAGLQPGDILTGVGGEAVRSPRDALDLIGKTAPGSELALAGIRNGRRFQTTATIIQRPSNP